eukprot:g5266.t1
MTILVAFDGSRVSRMALRTAIRMRGAGEKIVVYHAYREKSQMPGCYSKEYLAMELQTIAMRHGVPLREFEICIEDRSEDDVVSDMILSKAHAVEGDVSMLIIGAFGRKGPSVWAIGGNCEKSLLRCRVPIVTAKATSNLAAECHTWLVHSDGSDEAAAALQLALSRARPGMDRICALTIRDEWKENRGFDTRAHVEAVQEQIQHRGEAIAVAKDRASTIAQQLSKVGRQIGANYICIGKDDGGIGSTATHLLRGSKATVIIAAIPTTKKN